MAAYWWWSWSIGLEATDYTLTDWTLSTTSASFIDTAYTGELNSPVPGSSVPSEEYNLRLRSTHSLITPTFTAIDEGWYIVRWNGNSTTLNASSATRIVELLSTSTVRVAVRALTTTITAPLQVLVNGTLVGSSTGYYGNSTNVIAVDFDLTQTPPQAGLVVDGIREVALAGGSGTPTTINRVRIGTGNASSFMTIGDVILFDDLTDLTDSQTQDVWITYMTPDAVTDSDASWTPSDTTDLGDISDNNSATNTSTTTDPDSIVVNFESVSDRSTGWSPTTVHGVAAVVYATADTITTGSLTLDDGTGTAASNSDTVDADGHFILAFAAQDSGASAWTASTINAANITYTVSS